jgi:hypothetical protein
MADKEKPPFPFKKKVEGKEDPENPEEEEEPEEKGTEKKVAKKPPFPPKKDSCNPEFSKRVSARIKKYKNDGLDEDVATSRAWAEVKMEMLRGDSVARMSREGKYPYYREGKIVEVVKDFPELKKAVDNLGGRPLPSYPHHEDADDLARCTGLYYNIVADETTRSMLGETYPDHEKGTMNSIGFWCDEVLGTDGLLHQVNIDLDHVAVSEDLIGRGGETVAVLDEMPGEKKEEQKVEATPKKPEGDEIEAIRKQLADSKKVSEDAIKQKDAEIELLKAKNQTDAADIRSLKEQFAAIKAADELKTKTELIGRLLDPRRRLGDDRMKVLKEKLEKLGLDGVKAQLEMADIYAPVRDSTDDEGDHLFPVDKTEGKDTLYKRKPEIHKGAY